MIYINFQLSKEYLEWRYIKIPFRKYHLFKFENDGKIKGILVLRARNIMGVKCGIIVDYLTVDENLIIKPFLKEFSKGKLDILFATCPENSPEFVSLNNSGFIKVPNFLMLKKLHVIIRLHSTNISNTITDFRKWFITFGDYDIF